MDQDHLFAGGVVLPSYRSGRLLPGLRLPVAIHAVNANGDIARNGDGLSHTKRSSGCREARGQLPRTPPPPSLFANEREQARRVCLRGGGGVHHASSSTEHEESGGKESDRNHAEQFSPGPLSAPMEMEFMRNHLFLLLHMEMEETNKVFGARRNCLVVPGVVRVIPGGRANIGIPPQIER